MTHSGSSAATTASSNVSTCFSANAPVDPMTPFFETTLNRVEEIDGVVTLELDVDPSRTEWRGFKPGQFNMLYAFGVGEVAISISGDASDNHHLVHTIRAVGAGSRALVNLEPGSPVGIRGPFGNSWPVEQAIGKDVLLVAGGLGLAPVRPALYHLLKNRQQYGKIALLYGARSPEEILFQQELNQWQKQADLDIYITVDHATRSWTGNVGLVTRLFPEITVDRANTVAMLCGPEVMMRACGNELEQQGCDAEQIHLSMERNMKCAIGFCGHCQYGKHFICKNGPIFPFASIRPLLSIREI